MDSLIDLEEVWMDEGYDDGFTHGEKEGNREGQEFGLAKGFQISFPIHVTFCPVAISKNIHVT